MSKFGGIAVEESKFGGVAVEAAPPPVSNPSLANKTLIDGPLFNATPEDRAEITSALTPQEMESETAKIYYDQKFGTDHSPEMVTAQIQFEYGDDATPQMANAFNRKAAELDAQRGWEFQRITDPETGISVEVPFTGTDLPDPAAFQKAERTIASSIGSTWARLKAGVKMTPEYLTSTAVNIGLQPPTDQFGTILNAEDVEEYAKLRADASKEIEASQTFQDLREWAKPDIELTEELASRYKGSKSQSLVKSLKEGNWEQFGADLADGLALEAPNFGIIVALGTINPNLSLAYAGGSTAAGRYATGVADGESPMEASAKATAHGIAEIVFESIGSTGQLKSLAKRKAKGEAVEGFTKKTVEIAREPVSEVGTQMTQNLIDGRPMMEGTLEAGTIGLGFGTMMSAYSFGETRRNKERKAALEVEIKAALEAKTITEAEATERRIVEEQRATEQQAEERVASEQRKVDQVFFTPWTLERATELRKNNTDEQIDALVDQMTVPDAQKTAIKLVMKTPNEAGVTALNKIKTQLIAKHNAETPWTLGDANRARKQNSNEQIDEIVDRMDIPAEQKELAKTMIKTPNEASVSAFNGFEVTIDTTETPTGAPAEAVLQEQAARVGNINAELRSNFEANGVINIDNLHTPQEGNEYSTQELLSAFFYEQDKAAYDEGGLKPEDLSVVKQVELSVLNGDSATVDLILEMLTEFESTWDGSPPPFDVTTLDTSAGMQLFASLHQRGIEFDAGTIAQTVGNPKNAPLIAEIDPLIRDADRNLLRQEAETVAQMGAEDMVEEKTPSAAEEALSDATLEALFAGGEIQPESQRQIIEGVKDAVGGILLPSGELAPDVATPETPVADPVGDSLREIMGITQIPGEAPVREIAEVDQVSPITAAEIQTSAEKAAEWEARVEDQWVEDEAFQEYLDNISDAVVAEFKVTEEEFQKRMWELRRRRYQLKKAEEVYQAEIEEAQRKNAISKDEVAHQNRALEAARHDAEQGRGGQRIDEQAAALEIEPRTISIEEVAGLIYRKIELTQKRDLLLFQMNFSLRTKDSASIPPLRALIKRNGRMIASIDAALQHVDRSTQDVEGEHYRGNAAKLADLNEVLDVKRFAEETVKLEAQAQAEKIFENIPRARKPKRLKRDVERFKKLREAGLEFEAKARRIKGNIKQDIAEMRGMTKWQRVMTFGDIQRNLMFAGDMSATGRQGSTAWRTNPIASAKAFLIAFKGMLNEKYYDAIDQKMKQDSRHRRRVDSDLAIIDLNAGHVARQELMSTRIVELLPWVKGSNRHMATYLNILRTTIFDTLVERADKKGGVELSIAETKQIAHIVNVMTGRGSIGKPGSALDQDIEVSRALTTFFAAPRFVASHVQALLQLRYIVKGPQVEVDGVMQENKAVRRIAQRNFASYMVAEMAFQVGFAQLMAQFGWEQEWDPESSEFLKLRKGDLVIDTTGGRSRLLGLFLLGAEEALAAHGIGELEYRGGFEDKARKYLSYKVHPMWRNAQALLFKENVIGQEVTPAEAALTAALPLNVSSGIMDYKEANEWGGTGTMADVYSAFLLDSIGISANIYEKP